MQSSKTKLPPDRSRFLDGNKSSLPQIYVGVIIMFGTVQSLFARGSLITCEHQSARRAVLGGKGNPILEWISLEPCVYSKKKTYKYVNTFMCILQNQPPDNPLFLVISLGLPRPGRWRPAGTSGGQTQRSLAAYSGCVQCQPRTMLLDICMRNCIFTSQISAWETAYLLPGYLHEKLHI